MQLDLAFWHATALGLLVIFHKPISAQIKTLHPADLIAHQHVPTTDG